MKKKISPDEITSETPQQPPFDAIVIMEGKDGHCAQVLITRNFQSEEEVSNYLAVFSETVRRSRSLKKIPFRRLRVCAIGRESPSVPRDPVKAARWWMRYLVRELESGRWVVERGRASES